MSQFLNVILSFPTNVFSVLMMIVVLYWLLVILGALQIESAHADGAGGHDLDVGGAEGGHELDAGGAEGGHDVDVGGHDVDVGGAEGGHDVDVGGAEGGHDVGDGHGHDVGDGHDHDLGDGHGHDAADGHAHEGGHHQHASAFGSLLAAIGLGRAPLTVVFSLIVFFAWVLCIAGSVFLGVPLAKLPLWLANTLLVVAVLIVAMLMTSITSRPLGRVFVAKQAPSRRTLVGRSCAVITGRVDGDFGQGSVDDGGADCLVQIRCDRPNELKHGDRARLVGYDARREAFLVEPEASAARLAQA
jgi:membrane protein implicated in regulation of membrane protease activity